MQGMTMRKGECVVYIQPSRIQTALACLRFEHCDTNDKCNLLDGTMNLPISADLQ